MSRKLVHYYLWLAAWFCYVSIEVAVTLRSAYFLCNCFRKLTIIRSISSTQLPLFIIIDNLSMSTI